MLAIYSSDPKTRNYRAPKSEQLRQLVDNLVRGILVVPARSRGNNRQAGSLTRGNA